MQVEASNLTKALSDDRPCGVDLDESEPLLLASFDAYRLFGQMSPWPKDQQPDWREIRDRSMEALAKSRDLRILGHLAAALLRTDGLDGFGQTLDAAATWLTEWWDETYPRIDEDAILRRNALNGLADRVAVVDGLRRTPLLVHRQLGSFCIRDIEIAQGQVTPGPDEPSTDAGQLDAVFAAVELDSLQSVAAQVRRVAESFRTIEAAMRDQAGTDAAPDFGAALTVLGRTQTLLDAQLTARAPSGSADGAAVPGTEGAREGTARVPGVVGTRAEAMRALDAVAAFFRSSEPSSPIPLFIERAKRLVGKDFLTVLEDVVPESVAQAKSVGGIRDDE